jgi:hypothetical protein
VNGASPNEESSAKNNDVLIINLMLPQELSVGVPVCSDASL